MTESLYAKQMDEGLSPSRATIVLALFQNTRPHDRSGDGDSKPLWAGATPAGRANFQ